MTQTKGPIVETIGKEIVNLDKQISDMEAELEAGERPLSWDEVDSSTVEETVAQERRLAILPRLIAAAKIKRLQLRIRRYQREAEPLEAAVEEAHRKLERAQAKKLKAEEEEMAARAEWSYPNTRLQKIGRAIKDLERELSELRGEA